MLPPFVIVALDVPGALFEVETFVFTPESGSPKTRYNVSYAKQLVVAGYYRALVPIDRQTMQEIADRNGWRPERVPYVCETDPGIAAPYVHNGRRIYILIDGIHRCVKALQAGAPFHAYLLTDDAARACLMPAEVETWGS